jgi:TfoX/Sxy family transcriptional regulator of competence genes
MKLIKPSPGLIAEFKAMAEQLPGAELRKMFGYDAAFVNGNMAVGLWQNTCVVKVSERDAAKLLDGGLAQPFAPMKGRVMSGWLELSEEVAHDPEELLAWAERAVAFVAALPPKLKKASKKASSKAKTLPKKTVTQAKSKARR